LPPEASATDRAPIAPASEIARPPATPSAAETDSDNDGYADRGDKCPKQAENRDGVTDYDGCPETIALPGDLTLAMYVTFPDRSAELDNEDEFTLSEIASLLASRPELRLAIGGHADANRERAVGQPLSLRRANAVKVWLIRKGA
jgi:outer membrane protein OmpA-like peptidoglycan-associated protein